MDQLDVVLREKATEFAADEAFVAVREKTLHVDARVDQISDEGDECVGGVGPGGKSPDVARLVVHEHLNVLMGGVRCRVAHNDSVEAHLFEWLEIMVWHDVLTRSGLVTGGGELARFT